MAAEPMNPRGVPGLLHVCALMPHSKLSGTFVGVDLKTGTGYAIHRCQDQEGRECFVLRCLPIEAPAAVPDP